jgi:hypothetical protein
MSADLDDLDDDEGEDDDFDDIDFEEREELAWEEKAERRWRRRPVSKDFDRMLELAEQAATNAQPAELDQVEAALGPHNRQEPSEHFFRKIERTNYWNG